MAAVPDPPSARRGGAPLALLLFGALAASALLWAKWWPLAHKVELVHSTGAWPGGSLLDSAGSAGRAPSPARAWDFTREYVLAIWPALVAALLVAAAVDALLPRRLLLRALAARGRRPPTVVAGLLAMPSMMCTCCSAPVAATLRRAGVPTGAALAYWIGNPVLNPAVLAFTAIVLPWPWVATRAAVGALLVFGAAAWVGRVAGDGRPAAVPAAPGLPGAAEGPRTAARRFTRTLARLSVTLVPEYLLVVFGIGLLRGWLFPLDGGIDSLGLAGVALAALAGTLVVVPTGGEIPILQGLRAAGAGSGVLGALLITLPAISLPSIAMLGRALGWRITFLAAGAVAACGVLAAAVLWALGG